MGFEWLSCKVVLAVSSGHARFYPRFVLALVPCFASSFSSFLSSVCPSAAGALAFSLSFFSACSSILTCLSSDSRSRLFVRPSPSSFPIRDFISALSISQAFRSRSCRCHSVCRKRITPARKGVSADPANKSTRLKAPRVQLS